jgi:hypothetical protein
MARKNHPIETDPIDMIGTCEKQVTPPGAFLVQGALLDTIYIYIISIELTVKHTYNTFSGWWF